MEELLLNFYKYIQENHTDNYGHLEILDTEIKTYESEYIVNIIKEFLKQSDNVCTNKK